MIGMELLRENVFGKEGDGSKKTRGSFFKGKGRKEEIEMRSPLPPRGNPDLLPNGDGGIMSMPVPPSRISSSDQDPTAHGGSVVGIEMSDTNNTVSNQALSSKRLANDDKDKPVYEQLPTSPDSDVGRG